MTSVSLMLPPEIIQELDLPYEGVRDVSGIVVAIEGLNVAASLVTLATLRPRVGDLAAAIRRWRLRRQGPGPMVLTVKGPTLDLRVELPPNVSRREVLDQLRPMLDDHCS